MFIGDSSSRVKNLYNGLPQDAVLFSLFFNYTWAPFLLHLSENLVQESFGEIKTKIKTENKYLF